MDQQTAVIALCMRQGSAKAVAQRLGVSRPTLYNWKTQLLGQSAFASMKPEQDGPQGFERAELEEQLIVPVSTPKSKIGLSNLVFP